MTEIRKAVRCAIYTRKSTEDGLEQEYNSLDAQYDACAAYALSQRHEGWVLVNDRYDDGGFSGGTMDRPALKRLLADIEAGRVDIILLYKIDRLTRSLSDFAKIVEILDKRQASFVSITQSFNTTTSMGRLTLNMLLSFAQFEREVTGERIRDKIAASKRKGIWMGGPVPLGYDVVDRKLVINATEAQLVCHIMQRYLELGSVKSLISELDRIGVRTKVQKRASGPHKGGCPFRRGTLYHLLSNRIYLGEIVHKGESYPGEHQPIVPAELWHAVQRALANRSQGGTSSGRARYPSLLVGMVRDGEDRDMTPSHTNKGNRRFRYYVTRPDQLHGTPAWRLNAHDLERLVCDAIAALLTDKHRLQSTVGNNIRDGSAILAMFDTAEQLAQRLTSAEVQTIKELLIRLRPVIKLRTTDIEINLPVGALVEALGVAVPSAMSEESIELRRSALRVRKGHEVRLVLKSAKETPQAPSLDRKLVELIAETRGAAKLLAAHSGQSLSSIARQHGKCRTRLGKLIELSCLAPDIVVAIVAGKQPKSLTVQRLVNTKLPLAWTEQRQALGFS